MGKLDGKVALVTGAASGLGAAVAKLYAAEGAVLCMNSYSKSIETDSGKSTIKEIMDAGYAEPTNFVGDLTDVEFVNKMIDDIVAKHGRIDVIANVAGFPDYAQYLAKVSHEDFDKTIANNLTQVFNVCHAAIPYMQKQKSGTFVNCASIGGKKGYGGGGAYVAAKHGLVGLGRAITSEYIWDGIRCNTVCPGGMNTAMCGPEFFSHTYPNGELCATEHFTKSMAFYATALGEEGIDITADVEEIAPIFVFFACDDSKWIHGEDVICAGGLVLP